MIRLPKLNLYSLLVFYVVAREGNFTTASEELYLTQPAVTRRIQSLEEQIGMKLFSVRKKRVYLT